MIPIRLSENFKRHEFACLCGCGFDTVDSELVYALQGIRDRYNRSVSINSGCRCPEYNKRKGAKGSMHMMGRAADFVVVGIPASTVQPDLEKLDPHSYGIGSARA